MAIDKYQLLLILKEFYEEDDQCGYNCMGCNMSVECERLNPLLEKLFQQGNFVDLTDGKDQGSLTEDGSCYYIDKEIGTPKMERQNCKTCVNILNEILNETKKMTQMYYEVHSSETEF